MSAYVIKIAVAMHEYILRLHLLRLHAYFYLVYTHQHDTY